MSSLQEACIADRAVLRVGSGGAGGLDEALLPVRVAAMASRWPERIALDQGGHEESYGSLERRANALAERLAGRGVGPETVVGLVMGRRPETVVAMLAIWKAGGAYAPLDPDAPGQRLAGMLADCGARLVITERALAERLPDGVERLLVDGKDDPFAGPEAASAWTPPRPDQLAYVIFTSGTTGRPKGVGVTHGALAMHVAAIGRLYGMEAADRVLHVIAWSFDGATECWTAALAHGGCLVLGDPRGWTAEDALREIRRSGTTVVGMSPALLASLAEAHERQGAGPLPVRSWTAGGEAFGIEAFERVRRAFWPARIINGYGPTETVITPLLLAVTAETDPSAWAGAAWLPIGRPVGARTAHVLDAALNEVGIGVEGELHIGGAGLARGYVGLPGLTAERFVPDPFGAPGGRLYRTGDRVRRRPDGALDYLGRLDQQLKIRGFRIEAGEVEAHLLAHPGCREAAAVAASRDGEAHLVAYVAGAATPEALEAHLAARLPEPMRPSLIVRLEALPRLASGKLDRRGLPAPEWSARTYEAPRTATETRLATLMAELLGQPRVGRKDGFFQLGGHSLLAAKLVAQIREKWGRNLPLKAVFETPALAELAERIDAAAPITAHRQVQPADRAAALPAGDMQAAIWRWQQAHPESGAWNIFGAARLAGTLDATLLQRCLDHALGRHEALRTRFKAGPAGVEQLIDPPGRLPVVTLDLRDLPAALAEERARRFADRQASTPFDLAREIPVRAGLARLGAEEWVFTLAVHHAVADGISMGILMEEIATICKALAEGSAPSLPPTLQLADYTAWRQRQDSGPDFKRRVAEACAALPAGWETHPVPTDRPRGGHGTAGARLRFAIPAPVVQALKRGAAALGATLAMATLTVLGLTLGARRRDAAIGLGLLSADRARPELERVVGCLLATELVVLRTDKAVSFADLLAAVRDERLAAQARGPVPFSDLKARLEADGRLAAGAAPFQVLFSYLRKGQEGGDLFPGVVASGFSAENDDEAFELEFDVDERPEGGLRVSLGYRRDLFDAATIQALAQDFSGTFVAAATELDRSVGRIPADIAP